MSQLGHDLELIRLEQRHNHSLAAFKAESLYQLVYLSFMLQVKVNRRNYNTYVVIYIT